MITTTLSLQHFYPAELEITEILETTDKIIIKLKSHTHSCKCPSCGTLTTQYHATYVRKVQDLPILGKNTELHIHAYEYQCENPDCPVTSLAESFDGFLNHRSRMTERLEDFICTLALESSCEGCARVSQAMGIRISGDSVIRLLLKRYAAQPETVCSSVIGIDDFAFKKRDTYGTIVVDEATHKPVAILEGRDSNTLKEWLKQNQHVKTITRDRAGAYASAINEVLPGAMQIADRFHLHQNFLEIVRNVLQGIVPANIKIPNEEWDNPAETAANIASEEPDSKKQVILRKILPFCPL